ncbi:hypothetical protein PSN45_001484 [Yamadazyma tenuis]|uniref:NAD-dependent protein deacylase n=1 Tax=Candida tenuis (strain ATCC 10573 / BCRC 21748 / CBS 615 / JCM 9827 / NBRC 10315 / NRRL Y-1498 / VKM Y-70) TaxID=590646 RepID=G3BFT4_CANTC|nr:DHS-like NAD/FAD-binding domain-containing protein [Yamadazyma tenuis ATCC 10573]EGV60726.1 DHS-like NAD/FAD-binding domain-containing protein [Yamadazyma tenuis ATCC 10573]WEJ94007.1 hypothetical protein PSN45_001484 [Yamadazyma tenuis]
MSTRLNKSMMEFQDHLRHSKRIVALVGAGLSASSGLPTFRGSQGLWKNFNMIDLATPDAFYIDPGLVWQFYSYRRHAALKAHPNSGHLALARLSQVPSVEFVTITQNVDGLSIRAGTPRHKLHEIHGSLFDLRCTSFGCNYVDHDNFVDPLTPALGGTEEEFDRSGRKRSMHGDEDTDGASVSPEFTPVKQLDDSELPRCPACGDLLRPGVVWFGESLSLQLLNRIDGFIEQGPIDLMLVVGTSGTVYPANGYVDRVRYKGGKVAIFNTDIEDSVVDGQQEGVWGFRGDAAETLPQALDPLISQVCP